MRIIGGRLRGHKLVSFAADHIRPTTDRVKETLFNVLMGELENSRVLDLFSGTGNLTAEAISRGALSVDSVESHPKSLKIMQENFEKLKIADLVQVHRKDVFKFINEYQGPRFDVILIDPPFTEKLADKVMQALSKSRQMFHSETKIVIERSSHEPMQSRYDALFCYKEKEFSDKTMHFFRFENEEVL